MSASYHIAGLGRKSERVYSELLSRLEHGELPTGSRLPREDDLCAHFGVSRTTVRRAIGRLREEGWLSVRQGSGTYVQRPPGAAERASRTISVMFPFDGEMLRRLQRAILEEEFLLSVYSNPGWSPALERTFLTQVLQERHRALLAYCTPNEPRNEDLLRDLEAAGVRVIHIEHYRHEPPEQSFVLPDYCRAGMMAATSLLIGGYPRLRFVQLKSEGPYADLLYRGFLDVLQDQRGRPDERDLRVYMKGSMTQEDEARARLDAFIESLEPGTGLLARSTGLARILHRQVLARGLRVPEDVGIVGLELLGESAEANAEVDSIHFDRWALLEEALRLGFAPRADRTQHWCSPTLCRRGSVRGGTDGAAV